jgi:tetratricopeptide (TPR) repeat protein
MKKILLICATILSLQLITGCAAMFVPSTDDPARKLASAQNLVEKQGRPIPAERLIREAIDVYAEQKNEIGLAQAYRIYGIFFNAQAINNWQKYYQENGFMDKSASYETRYQKALEYFEKSLSLAVKNQNIDMPSNLYLLMGFSYQNLKKTDDACRAFDKSLAAHKIMVTQNPQTKISVPKEYSSFENGVNKFKRDLSCKD